MEIVRLTYAGERFTGAFSKIISPSVLNEASRPPSKKLLGSVSKARVLLARHLHCRLLVGSNLSLALVRTYFRSDRSGQHHVVRGMADSPRSELYVSIQSTVYHLFLDHLIGFSLAMRSVSR